MGYRLDENGPTVGSMAGYMAALVVLSFSATFIAIAWGSPTSHPRIWQWVVAGVTITGITIGAFRLTRAFADLLISGSPD